MDFILVIPAFEESLRLPKYLDALACELVNQPFKCGIVVVDDGSSRPEREALLQSIRPLMARHPIIMEPVLLPENQGKGAAIMAGWSEGNQATWLAFVDADGAISPPEVVRLLAIMMAQNNPEKSIFASRIKMLGRTVERSGKRHLSGRLFAFLTGWLIDPRVYDSQCGFKIISAQAFQKIKGLLLEKRFAFDVELMAALLHKNFPIEEIPIDWADIPGSKISLVRDTRKMLFSLIKIRSRKASWT